MKTNYKSNSKKTFDMQAQNYDKTFYGKHARSNYKHILNEINQVKKGNILDVG